MTTPIKTPAMQRMDKIGKQARTITNVLRYIPYATWMIWGSVVTLTVLGQWFRVVVMISALAALFIAYAILRKQLAKLSLQVAAEAKTAIHEIFAHLFTAANQPTEPADHHDDDGK